MKMKIACKQLCFDELLEEKDNNKPGHWKDFIAIYIGRGMYDVYPVRERKVFQSGDFDIKKL